MVEKILGKIVDAQFGFYPDRPFLMGLQLEFKFKCGGVGDGARYTVNISDDCKWEFEEDRHKAFLHMIKHLEKVLKNANVNYVSELINKPVEVILDGNCFKDFRILTEVL